MYFSGRLVLFSVANRWPDALRTIRLGTSGRPHAAHSWHTRARAVLNGFTSGAPDRFFHAVEAVAALEPEVFKLNRDKRPAVVWARSLAGAHALLLVLVVAGAGARAAERVGRHTVLVEHRVVLLGKRDTC